MPDPKPAQAGPKSTAPAAGTLNPYRKYNYRITIAEGGIIGHFSRCDGIELITDRLTYGEGGQEGRVYQLVGPTHYLPVSLYYGVISTDSLGLWSWMEKTRRSQRDRRSVMLASGRYAMLDDGMGFSLVPWKPVIEQRLGQQIAATVRGGGVSWEMGRQRGLSIS